MVKVYSDSDITVITLSPNLSAGWRESKWLLLLLAIPVLAISVGWFLAGAVLIPPFAGLELGALALALHHVCRRAQCKQVIQVRPDHLVVEQGQDYPEQRLELRRPDVYLHVDHPERPLDLLELTLVAADTRLPVGTFLNNDEREETRLMLRRAGLMETSNRWWLRSA